MEVMQDEEEECVVPQIPIHRWYLVAYVGTSLSIISVLCNVLIARVLLQRKHSNFFFLGVLAVSDAFLSFSYGPVVAMDVVRYNVGVSSICVVDKYNCVFCRFGLFACGGCTLVP